MARSLDGCGCNPGAGGDGGRVWHCSGEVVQNCASSGVVHLCVGIGGPRRGSPLMAPPVLDVAESEREVHAFDAIVHKAGTFDLLGDRAVLGPGELARPWWLLFGQAAVTEDPHRDRCPWIVLGAGPRGQRDLAVLLEYAPGLPERGLAVLEQVVAPAAQDGVDARRGLVEREVGVHLAEADV